MDAESENMLSVDAEWKMGGKESLSFDVLNITEQVRLHISLARPDH